MTRQLGVAEVAAVCASTMGPTVKASGVIRSLASSAPIGAIIGATATTLIGGTIVALVVLIDSSIASATHERHHLVHLSDESSLAAMESSRC